MQFGFGIDSPFGSFEPATPADGCTQCGICLSSCPTFSKSHDPEQSPMGRIRLIRKIANNETGTLSSESITNLENCLGCYTCETVCPSKVNFGKMLDQSLAQIRKNKPLPAISRIMLFLAQKRLLLKSLLSTVYLLQVTGLRRLPARLGFYKLFPLKRLNDLLGQVKFPARLSSQLIKSQPGQRVALFTGCFTSVMEQSVQQSAIDIFNFLGHEVIIPEGQQCCGALHRHNGIPATADMMAKQNIRSFSREQADAIVTTSSGCGASLKAYDTWFEDQSFSIPVMDVCHYLVSVLKQHELNFDQLPLKIALHTPCTLRQHEGQEEAVSELLQLFPGLELYPLPAEPRCCGAGGSQVLTEPAMADALRDDVINEISKIVPDVVISSNLGCAMHIRSGLANAGLKIPLQHPVQLIAQVLCKQ